MYVTHASQMIEKLTNLSPLRPRILSETASQPVNLLESLPDELALKILKEIEFTDLCQLCFVSKYFDELTREVVLYRQHIKSQDIFSTLLSKKVHPAIFFVKHPEYFKNAALRWHPIYKKLLSLAQKDDPKAAALDLEKALYSPIYVKQFLLQGVRALFLHPELYRPILLSNRAVPLITKIASYGDLEATILILSNRDLSQIIFSTLGKHNIPPKLQSDCIQNIANRYNINRALAGGIHTNNERWLAQIRITMLTFLISSQTSKAYQLGCEKCDSHFLETFNKICTNVRNLSKEQKETALISFIKEMSQSKEGISFNAKLLRNDRQLSLLIESMDLDETGLEFFKALVKAHELHLLEDWPIEHVPLSSNCNIFYVHLLLKQLGYPERAATLLEDTEPKRLLQRQLSL